MELEDKTIPQQKVTTLDRREETGDQKRQIQTQKSCSGKALTLEDFQR
jgi:hypothetical protein